MAIIFGLIIRQADNFRVNPKFFQAVFFPLFRFKKVDYHIEVIQYEPAGLFQYTFPVMGDPSHATGRADLVLPAARAALAAGADGLLVELHPDPPAALSDGEQALSLDELPNFMSETSRIAAAMGREII